MMLKLFVSLGLRISSNQDHIVVLTVTDISNSNGDRVFNTKTSLKYFWFSIAKSIFLSQNSNLVEILMPQNY